MSYVTIVWCMIGTSALVLGAMHLLIWANDRHAPARLAFALLAAALAGVAITELGMMRSGTPEEWGRWVKWCHLPMFLLIVCTAAFVRLYLNAGRWWLLGTLVLLRLGILVANFAMMPNFNFAYIDSVTHITFLGEQVTVVGESAAAAWQWLGPLTGVVFVVFIVDALITVWRRGPSVERRKAMPIVGSMLAFVILAYGGTQPVIWWGAQLPLLLAPSFFIPLVVMTCELSRDAVRADKLARELLDSERQLDLAAASAGLGLCSWTGKKSWFTPRAREILGLAANDAIDMGRLAAMVHSDDANRISAIVDQALACGGDCSAQFRIVRADGAERWIVARGVAGAASDGRGRTLRGVLRDVTDQKQAEAEAEELRRELTHIGRVTTLGQLASSLAHELAQPLGAILRNAEAAELLLQHESPDLAELRAIVKDIHRDDRRAGEVIERLRSLLQRGKLRFELISVDSLVRDVSTLVQPDALARHIALSCEVEPGLPRVTGDRVHLSQVLLNLLVNAFDAMTEARRADRVVIAARADGIGAVELSVTDGGAGILPDQLGRIFEPFYTTKPTGMGMGLAVSRTIVGAHGGRLGAENIAGGGAKFHIVLPAAGTRA